MSRNIISEQEAIKIAGEWYDGDGSALYKIACHDSGTTWTLSAEDWKKAELESRANGKACERLTVWINYKMGAYAERHRR